MAGYFLSLLAESDFDDFCVDVCTPMEIPTSTYRGGTSLADVMMQSWFLDPVVAAPAPISMEGPAPLPGFPHLCDLSDAAAPAPILMEGPAPPPGFPHLRDLSDAATPAPMSMEGPASLTEEKRSRSKIRSPGTWKQHHSKTRYQAGMSYTTKRGKFKPAKAVTTRKDCENSCRFQCSTKVSPDNRLHFFNDYYELSQDRKYDFLANTTERTRKAANRCGSSKRQFTFRYFLPVEDQRIQVCKDFYLSTLAISPTPVYNVHHKKNPTTNVPQPDLRGKGKTSHRRVDDHLKDQVRDHINSFPRVESHYCRRQTSKQYLEAGLNLSKLYNMYSQQQQETGGEVVKKALYSKIFYSEFNISFHKPKKDRCDKCETFAFVRKRGEADDGNSEKEKEHVEEKNAMRRERNSDRESKAFTVTFDLQNVLTCPKSNVSVAFYKRKLNAFNLTAHVSATKKKYCAVWYDGLAGRGGNELASAFVAILEAVVRDHPDVEKIITWSDSCVAQNRNSVMSFAVAHFLKLHPHLKEVKMKYSTPGHSALQEVDNVHSQIERVLRNAEYSSPPEVFRLLDSMNKGGDWTIIRLNLGDFCDYQAEAKKLAYKNVPFASVVSVELQASNLDQVSYCTSFKNLEFTTASLAYGRTRRKQNKDNPVNAPKPLSKRPELSDAKVNDLKSMYRYMSVEGIRFYEELFG